MIGSKKFRAWLLLGALLALTFSLMPAHAAGGSTCEILGNVTLSQYENLAYVDGGVGTLAPSNIVCVGTPVVGTGLISGTFAFCKHRASGAAGHTSQCTGVVDWNGDGLKNSLDTPPNMSENAASPTEEALYSGLGANTPVIAHVVAHFDFVLGAQSCGFDLNGHTIGVQANLELLHFKCGTTPYPNAVAEAVAGFQVDPTVSCPGGQPQLCFKNVIFEGIQFMAQ